jgi:hypothetical protein
MDQHHAQPEQESPDLAGGPRSRDDLNDAWDRDAMATVGPLCAEPGCLHSTQRRYPGLPTAVLDWCPVHAVTPAT